ncbi:hypothetical protein GCM10009105_25000 [Dokdonella soli]|uniref:TNFR-Cys domain-containing protein n=1 Tax=Dokdonella soli TaxID=529810 RepID=A0ABP3TXH5_9GAMM
MRLPIATALIFVAALLAEPCAARGLLWEATTPDTAVANTATPICDLFADGYEKPAAGPCASCFDGSVNFTETDVDCGGNYCKPCADGKICASGNDCQNRVCSAGTCQPASCSDGVKNGNETDVDCGGPTCAACAIGKGCNVGNDCQSHVCTAGTCAAPTCFDGVKNGGETDIDCGGPTCSKCTAGKMCFASSDCVSNVCAMGVCGP